MISILSVCLDFGFSEILDTLNDKAYDREKDLKDLAHLLIRFAQGRYLHWNENV